jgi:sporulation protein YlmC with PRC-barrel domain/vacuolar-type H+-ATPase subunit E/Vma4
LQVGPAGVKEYAFNLGQIHTLGASILVNSGAQETDGDKVSQLESLIGCEVWSEAGERIGRVNDCVFNLKTGLISDYLISPGGLAIVTEGVYRLPPSKILSTGRRRILITEAAARSLEPYRMGIKSRLGKVTESLTQRAQSATEQAKEQAQLLAQQARERSKQVREESQFLAQQARERGQGFVEQVKERGQAIGEQVKENTQSWTEQVQEQLDYVVEELGSPNASWEAAEGVEALAEEDLLSGDWGLLPRPTEATPSTEPAPTIEPLEPTPELETTPAYVLDPPPMVTNLDDDFWDEPITPTLSSEALDISASTVLEQPQTHPTIAESVTTAAPEEPSSVVGES